MDKRELTTELEKYYKGLNVSRLIGYSDHKDSKAWLAEVAAILKNVDEGDFQSFSNLRQHLYPSIPRKTRKHAAEQIDGFVRQKVAEYKRYDFGGEKKGLPYVQQVIIEGFISKQDEFNYKKLVKLLNELNSNYTAGYPYSSSMVIRAILDHIPPLFDFSSFDEVTNNYPWSKTDKQYMKNLLDFKNEGDDALHRQISRDEDLLGIENLPNSNRLNRLLQECLKLEEANRKESKKAPQDRQQKGIVVKLTDKKVSWANYSLKHAVWSSFRLTLEIDNYNSNKPDYINVCLNGALKKGGAWVAKHFMFEGSERHDVEFRVEANEIQKTTVFISDTELYNSGRQPMPEIDKDSLVLEVASRSGTKFTIPLKDFDVVQG